MIAAPVKLLRSRQALLRTFQPSQVLQQCDLGFSLSSQVLPGKFARHFLRTLQKSLRRSPERLLREPIVAQAMQELERLEGVHPAVELG